MYIVPEAIVKVLRETETTQGVFAVCEKHEKEVALTDGKFLLLDGLQDPGNLGNDYSYSGCSWYSCRCAWRRVR